MLVGALPPRPSPKPRVLQSIESIIQSTTTGCRHLVVQHLRSVRMFKTAARISPYRTMRRVKHWGLTGTPVHRDHFLSARLKGASCPRCVQNGFPRLWSCIARCTRLRALIAFCTHLSQALRACNLWLVGSAVLGRGP